MQPGLMPHNTLGQNALGAMMMPGQPGQMPGQPMPGQMMVPNQPMPVMPAAGMTPSPFEQAKTNLQMAKQLLTLKQSGMFDMNDANLIS